MAGYVWRGRKLFDLMTADDETKAEWARYITLNRRSAQAYSDLRAMEMEVPRMLPSMDIRGGRGREIEVRRQRIAEVETIRL